MKMTPALRNEAVLKSYEVGVQKAAEIFDLDEDVLIEYRRNFIKSEYSAFFLNDDSVTKTSTATNWIERIRENPFYELTAKMVFATILILICWIMPEVLKPFVDPLTNTIVWLGFTSLYLVMFIGIGIDVILWVQHKVNFDFLNPTNSTGLFDYSTLIRSDQLSAYEKCRLNQQKYLAYLAAFCLLIMGLASLTSGGGN